MMKADGFDEAIIGVGRQFDKPDRLIYDYDKCLGILMLDQDFTEEEAIDWMEYNVLGAYVGEGTPIFKIDYIEDEVFGLENAPAQFCKLMRGENFGKTIVTIQ